MNKINYYNQDLDFKTLSGLIRRSIHLYGERPFFGVKREGTYEWMTYSEFGIRMRKMRSLLKSCGLKKGDRVALIANNSIEFALTAYASYGLGCVIVPMYEVQKVQDWEHIFSDSQPRLAVVSNDTIREKVEGLHSPGLEHLFVIRPTDASAESLASLIDKAELMDDTDDEDVSEDDLCDIIYTSGTTGRPHGVELTHRNVVQNVIKTANVFNISCKDRILSFLPWAHAFGKTVDFHIFPSVGAAVGLVENNRTISQNLLEVNPTILCAVPKIFNKIYDTAHFKASSQTVKRLMFAQTEVISDRAKHGGLSLFGKLQHKVLDRLVASKVREAFGNSLRFCISGGASLSKEVATFFDNFGVQIYEGCGMTEHAPIIAVNIENNVKIGSVGLPLPGVHVSIESDNEMLDKSNDKCGEIVVESDCVMKCYHNDPTGTASAIDEKGRLHTGDMGYIDEDGFLYITGRVKEQYKLENGKYVVPTALEEKINNSTFIDLSVVFGSGKPYNIVLIRPSDDYIEKFKKENHLENASQSEIENHPKLREVISNELRTACEDFRGYERPQKFAIILEPFTIQSGLLTPALKIKRREVEKRFAELIASLYK